LSSVELFIEGTACGACKVLRTQRSDEEQPREGVGTLLEGPSCRQDLVSECLQDLFPAKSWLGVEVSRQPRLLQGFPGVSEESCAWFNALLSLS
jgi:hypothetical protein